MNILSKILETKREEMLRAKAMCSFDEMLDKAHAVNRPVASLSKALLESSTGIISEFKRRSPSKGFIKEGAEVSGIVKGYAANGATAISVLTDKDYFAGELADLEQARKVTNIPILRKDFIIDSYQICEARISGADAILLIAAALTPAHCNELAAFAASLGLEVLLELHNESELDYIKSNIHVVGINNRDLTTFVTDTDISKRLAALLPQNIVRISESGISSPETVKNLRESGFSGFLMGENFMKQPDPAAALGVFIKNLEE